MRARTADARGRGSGFGQAGGRGAALERAKMGQQQTKAESYTQAANVLTSDQLLIIKKQFRHLVN